MKISTKVSAYVLSIFTMASIPYVNAQQADDELFELSLEELMQIPIESASKKKETLFEAPLASYTITSSEITRSGVNNIPEALRLAPGMIVRQQTNGVYDVQIRGLDNLTRGGSTVAHVNTATLVMIDNRPVFNHNIGGVFWESIPVDISDIERIEIVRGPAAALFGPNAVTGVINIITKNPDQYNTSVVAHAEYGSNNSFIASGRVSKRINDELSIFVSGNYQERERFTNEFINGFTGEQGSVNQLPEFLQKTQNGDLSLERIGINSGVTFSPNDNIEFDLTLGHQDNGVLKNFIQNSPISLAWAESNSSYINLNSSLHNLNVRTSYWRGSEDASVNLAPGRYDFSIFETMAEYEISIGEIGRIMPGASYTLVEFSDEDYLDSEAVYLQGDEFIETRALSIRSDWKLTNNWRLIAALRVDDFTTHSERYPSYQVASTYSINEKNIIRASISRSNSGSFVGNNFLNITDGSIRGSKNIDLFKVRSIEIGYRSQLSSKVQIDVDLFRQNALDPAVLTISRFTPEAQPLLSVENSDVEAVQTGMTVSMNIVPSDKLQFKPFVTVQNTKAENVPTSYLGGLDPTFRVIEDDHEQTPSIYGGWFANYSPNGKLNVNLSGYFQTEQTIYDYRSGPQQQEVYDGKLLLNATIGYNVKPWVTLFANARNMLGNNSREFINTEKLGSYYGTGMRINFNN